LPVGVYGGPRALMEKVAPSGPVYQAGTLSGNPLAMEAGIAMLQEIARSRPHAHLEKLGAELESRVREAIGKAGVTDRVCYERAGSLSTLFFGPGPMTDFTSVKRSDTKRYAAFFHAMLERGIFLPPAQFEAWFLSTAHGEKEIRKTARAVEESLRVAFSP
jgi:glutamate-1-semialdehyde 2,1-aminomutase